jgi:exodeoxyribonuclease VII small subunit
MTTKVSYRQLKTELDRVMLEIQAENLDIDEATELYKRGLELIKQLEDYLKTTRNTISHLKPKPISSKK